MRFLFVASLLLVTHIAMAQDHGFPFGQATYKELDMKVYSKDTAAVAVVLNEFAEAYVDNSRDNNLLFEYHAKIKILRQEGLEKATIEIPLYKSDSRIETVRQIKASSFSYENGSMKEVKLDPKNIYKDKLNQFWDVTKFPIPNVRVGTVIEFQYTIESPFIYNFRNWEFQSDIPKVYSEYWATVPANYKFNMTLRGFLELSKNESELVQDCFTPGGGNKADCARYKWAMKDIPAFKEEEFMTAKSNFLSMINFELSEVQFFDGRKDKFTKEWKDAEQELRQSDRFGIQLKRGKSIVDEHVELLVAGETNPLEKARKIYDFIKGWYRWNDDYGKYSESGIKKAFDSKVGNVGDINLSLIAALNYAGIATEPMLLSTRSNGLPTEVHPVLSDFNYVVAKANIQDKVYLLDATDDFLPFGMLPERCLNGKGRVMGEKESYWYDLKATERARSISMATLKLDADGTIRGTLQTTYSGYEAVRKRKAISLAGSKDTYIKNLNTKLKDVEITEAQIENPDDLKKPLVVKLSIAMNGFDSPQALYFLFNPFIVDKDQWSSNPFKSNERLYPVDFGVPLDQTSIIMLEYPAAFEPVDLPAKIGLALPNAGGRYLFDVKNENNKLTINNSLQILKPVFTSDEYHFLKELFARVIVVRQTDIMFKKKP